MDPKITFEFVRNPGHETVPSDRQLKCLEAAVSGAWFACLSCEGVRHLVRAVHLRFELADDGSTPTKLTVKVWFSDSEEEATVFPLYQFTTREPDFLRDSVVELLTEKARLFAAARVALWKRQIEHAEKLLCSFPDVRQAA